MRIVVLTSGGDAPGMNAFLAQLDAKKGKNEIFAAMEGFSGLVHDNLLPLTSLMPKVFARRAGTVIKSSRCPEFKTIEGVKEAVKNLNKNQIDCVIVVGGNGSLKGAKELIENNVKIIFVPGTIDNDVNYSDYSIGFDTAVFQASKVISDIMPSMESFNRSCIFEVMGREEPDIAFAVAKNVHADLCIVNKKDLNEGKLVKLIQSKNKNFESAIIVIREQIINVVELQNKLNEKLKNDVVRNVVIGYMQRGGYPTIKEMKNAKEMANLSLKLIKKQDFNKAIGYKNNKIQDFEILDI